MKKLNMYFSLFTALVILTSSLIMGLIGCGDNISAISQPTPIPIVKNGFSEYDFAANNSLFIEPNNVGITFLEPKDSSGNTGLPDTGGADFDEMSIHISEPNTYVYSFDPNDTTDTIDSIVMKDSSGKEIFHINKQNPTASVYLQTGNYNLLIYSGYTQTEESKGSRTVFVYSATSVAGTGLTTSYKFDPNDVRRLISTNSCPYGDLTGALLPGANLEGANLSRANLNNANLEGANLPGANLNNVKLTGANLIYTNLLEANLTWADLSEAKMNNVNLYRADLQYVNLYKANLSGAHLNKADLTGASLIGADLRWVDLRWANLRWAKMTGVIMYMTCLTGAIMPDGSVF